MLTERGTRRGDQASVGRECSSPQPQNLLTRGIGQSQSASGVSPNGHSTDGLARHPRHIAFVSFLMNVPP